MMRTYLSVDLPQYADVNSLPLRHALFQTAAYVISCQKDARGGCILPALYGHGVLRRFPGSDSPGPQGQFLGEQPQGLKLFIQPGKFTAQDVLVTAFLFLQRLDLHNPSLHGGGAAATGPDEVIRPLLVLRDLLFDRQVELLGHLVALLGVVDEVEAVGEQWGIVAVKPTDLLDERLEYHHLLHGVPGHEIEMPVDTDLGSVQRPQELQADGLDLFAVGACLVEFKELLGLNAILHGVHILIVSCQFSFRAKKRWEPSFCRRA